MWALSLREHARAGNVSVLVEAPQEFNQNQQLLTLSQPRSSPLHSEANSATAGAGRSQR